MGTFTDTDAFVPTNTLNSFYNSDTFVVVIQSIVLLNVKLEMSRQRISAVITSVMAKISDR